MAIKYCKCGGKTEYSFDEPKFCSKCGKPFNGSSAHVDTTKILKATEAIADDDFSEENVEAFASNLPALDPSAIVLTHEEGLNVKFRDLAKGAGPHGRTSAMTPDMLRSLQREESRIRDIES